MIQKNNRINSFIKTNFFFTKRTVFLKHHMILFWISRFYCKLSKNKKPISIDKLFLIVFFLLIIPNLLSIPATANPIGNFSQLTHSIVLNNISSQDNSLDYQVIQTSDEKTITISGHVYTGDNNDSLNPASSVRLIIAPSLYPDKFNEKDIFQEKYSDNSGYYQFNFIPGYIDIIEQIIPKYYHIILYPPDDSKAVTARSSSGIISSPTSIVLPFHNSKTLFENNNFWILFPPTAVFDMNPSSGIGTTPLTIQFSDISKGNPTSREWNFGDGTTSSLQDPQHTYSNPGIYTVIFTASNEVGSTAVEKRIYAQDQPILKISPSSGKTGISVNADGSFSIIPQGERLTMLSRKVHVADVFFDDLKLIDDTPISEDGSFSIPLIIPDGVKSGPHEITVSYGNEEVHATFTVTSIPPEVSISANPSSGKTPLEVQFSAEYSMHPDDEIKSIEWDFGDNTRDIQKIVNHTYHIPGKYLVKLTITGNIGLSGTDTTQIQVFNTPPIAYAMAEPMEGTGTLTYRFEGSRSYDPDGNITSFHWDFGDGNTEYGQTVLHTFKIQGSYHVILTVTDELGSSIDDPLTVRTGNRPPVAIITIDLEKGDAPFNITSDGSESYDPDNDNLTYSWKFGDGQIGTGKIVHHIYKNAEEYPLTLTVTDTGGLTNSTTVTIIVNSPFPLLLILILLVGTGASLQIYRTIQKLKSNKIPEENKETSDDDTSPKKPAQYPDLSYEFKSGIECTNPNEIRHTDIKMEINTGILKKGENNEL